MKISDLLRDNIRNLRPYVSARDECERIDMTYLDANECPFGMYNRYPDPYQKELKAIISDIRGIAAKNIFVSSGSDEIIDHLFRAFCIPGVDKSICFTPGYAMYEVSAEINNVDIVKIPLNEKFQIDIVALNNYLHDPTMKLMFICSPNNPTANLIDRNTIEYILNHFNGILVLDEAYIDYSLESSLVKWVENYPNLFVLQTLSKAWGLAGVRVGMGFGNLEIIEVLNKMKAPYNVSQLSQQIASDTLKNISDYKANVNLILSERKRVESALKQVEYVKKVFPSDANFLFVIVDDADKRYQKLKDHKIVVRNRDAIYKNSLRISIGAPQENDYLINAMYDEK